MLPSIACVAAPRSTSAAGTCSAIRSARTARFGVNPWQLMEWMGHERIDETMGYVHVAERHRSIPPELVAAGMHETDPTARIVAMLGARAGQNLAKTASASATSTIRTSG